MTSKLVLIYTFLLLK